MKKMLAPERSVSMSRVYWPRPQSSSCAAQGWTTTASLSVAAATLRHSGSRGRIQAGLYYAVTTYSPHFKEGM